MRILGRMFDAGSTPPDQSVAVSARSEVATWFGRGVGAASGALFVVMLATGFVAAGRAALLVFVALLLGAALDPLVDGLRGRLPIPRGAAILAVYLVFLAIAVVLAVLVVPGAVAQAGELASAAPAALERARSWAAALVSVITVMTLCSSG